MKNEREIAFDIARTIAMIMVIMIHVSNVYSRSFGIIGKKSFIISLIINTVCRVSVPIFLMISGTLLLDRKFQLTKYCKRIVKYILLIVVWDSIYLIWEYFYLGTTYNQLHKLLFGPLRAHLWFLYTILIIYIVQPILKIIMNKSNTLIKIILLLTWIFFSTVSMLNHTLAQYFTIFSYIGFFILGKYLYDFAKTKNIKKYNIPLALLMIVLFTISIILNYQSSLKYNMFYNMYFAYRTPFIMFSSLAFFLLLVGNFHKSKGNKVIRQCSDLSLGVYLIHGIFLDITVKKYIYQLIPSILGIPIFTFIIIVESLISVYILKKIIIIKELL